jgi:hypothetical protein
MTLLKTESRAGPNPGICPLQSRLLQLAVGWAPHLCHQTPATYPARCSPPGFQPSQVLSCHPAAPHTLLASSLSSLPLQDHSAYLLPTEQQEELPLPYHRAMLKPYTTTQKISSATSGLLALPPLREGSSCSAQSKIFSVLTPQRWNQLPP